ncbi:MAG TPA: putative C-S lyase [Bacteroides sp.]|nr:putative C-S lyase [Bacteroides sp.]
MNGNFDRSIERKGTDSVKHDLLTPVFGSEDVLPMWVADMDFEAPHCVQEAILRRAEHPVYGYTFRPERFYRAVSGWIGRRHGWNVDPGTIGFSPGIVPALNMCVMAFTQPGDRIVIQPPVYFPFFSAVSNHLRTIVHNQLVEHDGIYEMDFDHLEESFRDGVKMFILCHPHNPVGRAWRREELERLAGLCTRYGVMVISDEIHSDLVLNGNTHIPLASLGKEIADLTITCVSPSKTFNLAGLHTSVVIISRPDLKKEYDRILDMVHVGGGNIFGMVALEAAYTGGDAWLEQLIGYLEGNDRALREHLRATVPQLVISPLEATYLAWLDLSFLGMDDRALRQFVIGKARLGLNDGPMFGPGGTQHQRMNIATPRNVLMEGARRLSDAIRSAG